MKNQHETSQILTHQAVNDLKNRRFWIQSTLISSVAGAMMLTPLTKLWAKISLTGDDAMAKAKKTTTTKSSKAKGKSDQSAEQLAAGTGEEFLLLDLEIGQVKIKLRPDLAPKHVERIKTLTKEEFYNGVVFHRVIDGFMAQTGDPTGTGSGKSSYPDLKAEFSREHHTRGTVSMARAQSPDSANSQFFICFDDAPWLDGQYTIWGQVVSGMEAVDALPKGRGQSGMVPNPGRLIKASLSA